MSVGIDLYGLRGFVAVAEFGSFHEAATAIALSQSALSRRVQKLEDALGVTLLERTTRRVVLTVAGREFLPRARRLIDELEEALTSVRELTERQGGRVTIACVPSVTYYFLPLVLRRFNAEFPQVRIRLIDEAASEVLQRVRDGRAELGVTFLGQSDEDIAFTPIRRDPFVLVCREDHPLARQESVRWVDLQPYPYITAGLSSGNRLLIESALGNAAWRPRPFFEMQHLPSTLGLVEAGLGITALPRLSLPLEPHAVLTCRPLMEPEIIRTMGVIRRRGSSLSRPARALHRLLAEGRWS
ncbi:LysR family transcriptional regulator [Roseomonas marmotae]|uniref:LysR family transcriptional regulator n=1 Tax=Roseomonas marmotae TaxID=2768161 RepID=A0ABS3KHK1_9PROT|nr:LysR family transcriptional regulator [Roseomonas marmotae]MBO1076944.1 LysR family transcriptional regulator [Roseomonas marmotae]QTI82066.1 LysR family transcriptional regulator [Roseomonas marmotae]